MPEARHSSGFQGCPAARPTPGRRRPTPRCSRPQNLRPRDGRSLGRDADSVRELLGYAFVDAGREARALVLADAVEIEHVLLAPVAHHLKPREHIHIVYVADPMNG